MSVSAGCLLAIDIYTGYIVTGKVSLISCNKLLALKIWVAYYVGSVVYCAKFVFRRTLYALLRAGTGR
jgi:hypothetical protein